MQFQISEPVILALIGACVLALWLDRRFRLRIGGRDGIEIDTGDAHRRSK